MTSASAYGTNNLQSVNGCYIDLNFRTVANEVLPRNPEGSTFIFIYNSNDVRWVPTWITHASKLQNHIHNNTVSSRLFWLNGYWKRQLFTIFCQCYKESLFRWSFIWRVFQRLCLLNFCHAYKISKYHNNGNIWMLYIPLLTWFDCIFPSLPIWLLLFMTLFVSSLLSLFLRKLHISHVQRRVINPTYLIEI